MAPKIGGAIERGAALCQLLVLCDHRDGVKLLGEIISVFSPQESSPTKWECGPGGSRTRICTLTESRATRCTTGPEGSVWGRRGDYKSTAV